MSDNVYAKFCSNWPIEEETGNMQTFIYKYFVIIILRLNS